jgi:hypothetical protein
MTRTARPLLATIVLAAVVLAALPARAEEDRPHPVEVGVGKAVPICETGTILCPALSPICDDTAVATMRVGDKGMEIVGVKAGKTLCSALAANQMRRVYEVTVR